MRLVLLFVVSVFSSIASLCGQNTKQQFEWIHFAQIAPYERNTYKLNGSTNTWDTVRGARYLTVIDGMSIDEEKVVNQKQVHKSDYQAVMDILLNDNDPDRIEVVSDCYIPRNGILFFDIQNHLIGFIEICFECNKIKTTGICEKWDIDLGNTDYRQLEEWFKVTYVE
ncbi:hypothetical protein G3O08_17800 [Cryomorpha ignava]|uniref:Uncharacterized protein n=1 Tax=Cryomorpha ignava TaxID=101383 RepID=A0A7K3WUK1_9FLAO|nr:hypothetical protein [Cryomorpha ignava]NEN25353.1 hypothetical protein [Cryomorpha ignava]